MTSGYFQISKIGLHGQKYESRGVEVCCEQTFAGDCSTCSSHGLNDGINASFARDVTLKSRRGQKYVGLVILAHKIIDGPSNVYIRHLPKIGPMPMSIRYFEIIISLCHHTSLEY